MSDSLMKDMIAARMRSPDWDPSEMRTIPARFAELEQAVRARTVADACYVIQQSIDTIKGERDWEESATMRTSIGAREHILRLLGALGEPGRQP